MTKNVIMVKYILYYISILITTKPISNKGSANNSPRENGSTGRRHIIEDFITIDDYESIIQPPNNTNNNDKQHHNKKTMSKCVQGSRCAAAMHAHCSPRAATTAATNAS